MRRAALIVPIAGLVIGLVSCESPILAGRPTTDVYTFTLDTDPPTVLRWPSGRTVRLFVVESGDAARDALLAGSVAAGAAAWNARALFGEFALETVTRVEDADIVLSWSDAILPVETEQCRPQLQRAVTTFCITGFDTDSPALTRFPLAPPADAAAGDVRMLVTFLGAEALFPDRLTRLVAHELGHVLGIGRHSADAGDLMYSPEPARATPSARDAATVQVLYHTRPDIETN